jgi:hypothetical protein
LLLFFRIERQAGQASGVGGGAKPKGGQLIENKQFGETGRFRASMISSTYDR